MSYVVFDLALDAVLRGLIHRRPPAVPGMRRSRRSRPQASPQVTDQRPAWAVAVC